MHWIQRDILKKLATSESCRYSDLRPEGVDGNLFMYHLKQLTADGYIKKDDKSYTLTSTGKSFIAGMSLSTGKPTRIPRVFVMIYCTNINGQTLLYKWSRQPYLGHVSLPFNRLRYGESIVSTAKATLCVKSGLSGTLKYRGVTDVIVQKVDKISTHYTAHIFEACSTKEAPTADGLTGEPFWGDIDEFDDSDTVYGTKEILQVLKTKKSPFFEEILVKK